MKKIILVLLCLLFVLPVFALPAGFSFGPAVEYQVGDLRNIQEDIDISMVDAFNYGLYASGRITIFGASASMFKASSENTTFYGNIFAGIQLYLGFLGVKVEAGLPYSWKAAEGSFAFGDYKEDALGKVSIAVNTKGINFEAYAYESFKYLFKKETVLDAVTLGAAISIAL